MVRSTEDYRSTTKKSSLTHHAHLRCLVVSVVCSSGHAWDV